MDEGNVPIPTMHGGSPLMDDKSIPLLMPLSSKFIRTRLESPPLDAAGEPTTTTSESDMVAIVAW